MVLTLIIVTSIVSSDVESLMGTAPSVNPGNTPARRTHCPVLQLEGNAGLSKEGLRGPQVSLTPSQRLIHRRSVSVGLAEERAFG